MIHGDRCFHMRWVVEKFQSSRLRGLILFLLQSVSITRRIKNDHHLRLDLIKLNKSDIRIIKNL